MIIFDTTLRFPLARPRSSGGLLSRIARLAEARPEVPALERLRAVPDEVLAARGLTRIGEIRRIMGPRFLL